MRPVSSVRRSAASFIQANMSTSPVPCSCTMAPTRPSALYCTPASSASEATIGVTAGVGGAGGAAVSVAGSMGRPRYRPCRASLGLIRRLRAILRQNPAVSEPAPPLAPARPTRLVHESDVRVDPWFWLRERDDPEVIAHLEAENAYTRDALAHLSGLRRELYDEIVGRVQESDTSAPVRRGAYEYFTRTVEGLQYGVHCRRPASDVSGESALPDPFATPGTAPGEIVVLDE